MADSYVIYTANGSTDTFNITFGYLDPAHVFVTVDNVPAVFTFPTGSQAQISSGNPINGAKVRVYRVTPRDVRQVVWQNAANLTADDLNTSDLQLLYIVQEAFDLSADAMNRDGTGNFDAKNLRIRNVADPVEALDAVNKQYADTIIEQADDYAVLSEAWANYTGGVVDAGEYSSKAYAIGGVGVTNTAGKGAAKEWATKTGGTVDTVERSAKAYAQDDLKGSAGGSAKDWAITPENTQVAGGEYSAKHYAAKTAADRIATAADRIATAADRVQTGLDRVATGNDVVTTNNAVLQAQAYANSMAFRDVVFITSANSPYAITQASHNGKMISVDTSGGNVIINLPQISGLTLPFVVAMKKATGDTNTVTINRAGTDTINDGSATNKVLTSISGSQFIPDVDPSPDRWTTIDFGSSAGEMKNQSFAAGVGFTAGSSTTVTLTNTPLPSSSTALSVYFDGVRQHPSEWSLNTTTGVITFTSAIPTGTLAVFAEWVSSVVTIGTPSDGTVTYPKMNSGAIASFSDVMAGTASKLVPSNVAQQMVGKVLLVSQTASGASQLDFVSPFSSLYDEYELEWDDFLPSTNQINLILRFSQGGVFDGGANADYSSACSISAYSGGSAFGGTLQSNAAGGVYLMWNHSNSSNFRGSGVARISRPMATNAYKSVYGIGYGVHWSTSDALSYAITSHRRFTAAVDGIRILASAGTFSGNFRLYGIRK